MTQRLPLQEYDEETILGRRDETSFQLLLNAGVHPSLAACLAEPAQDAGGIRQLLLAWALLLAHLQQQPPSARGRAWLTESLTEVEGCGLAACQHPVEPGWFGAWCRLGGCVGALTALGAQAYGVACMSVSWTMSVRWPLCATRQAMLQA